MIKVGFNGKNFVVLCEKYEAEWPKNAPARRWNDKRMEWTLPAVRINANYIKEKEGIFISDNAKAKIKELERIYDEISKETKPLSWEKFPFKLPCRNYQSIGLQRISGSLSFAFFMDMGTGKTKMVVDWAVNQYMNKRIKATVVVVPSTIKKNWVKELDKHCPVLFDAHILLAGKYEQFKKWTPKSEQAMKWLIVGVESFSAGRSASLVQAFVSKTKAAVIVDESSKIKNASALRTKACIKLSNLAVSRGIMSGTPVNNNIGDLFSQFEFLNPNIIGAGSYYNFKNRYFVMGGYEDKEIIGYKNVEEVINSVSPFIYQVRKKDVLKEIPDKVFQERVIKLSAQQKKIYKQIISDMLINTEEGSNEISNTLEKCLRLQEVTGGFYTTAICDPERPELVVYQKHGIPGPNPKVTEVLNIINETDEQIIIWAIFKSEIDIIVDAIVKEYGPGKVVVISGKIKENDRNANIDKFQNGSARFMVANPSVGGIGIDLTAGTVNIYFSNNFNLEIRLQSEDRSHRHGQKNVVTYIDIVAEKTVDVKIIKALKNKQNFSDYVKDQFEEIFM